MQSWKIENGFGVYDAHDDKLGTVGYVWDDHFKMDTGILGLGKDYFVPYSAITDVRGNNVYLGTTKERLEHSGWDSKEAFLRGSIGAGPERPPGGFQNGLGGGPDLAGDEEVIPSDSERKRREM